MAGTSSTSSCGWKVDGARDVGAEPGVFLTEAARDGAADPARVVAFEAGTDWSCSMTGLGRLEKEGERGFRARAERESGLDGGEMVPHSSRRRRRGTSR